MNLITTIFQTSIIAGITLIVLQALIIWLFIRSAIASGVKKGILAAHEEIQKPKKTPEQEVKEEFDGWK